MTTTFKIHPAIGLARLGNSETNFFIAPEQLGKLPIECDSQTGLPIYEEAVEKKTGGKVKTEKRVEKFRDAAGKLRRQAARFRVYSYDNSGKEQGEITAGGSYQFELASGETVDGTVTDIVWTAHLANKKAAWYEFKETQGMHGYAPDHPLRNAKLTTREDRLSLIIDPGPQTVSYEDESQRHKQFSRDPQSNYPQHFPPTDMKPHTIDTLGDVMATRDGAHLRLLVLGGHGKSGTTADKVELNSFVNNDGWYDDVSDGPVTAVVHFTYQADDGAQTTGTQQVQHPAWCIVGYPRYAPEIEDLITMDDLIYDVSVKSFPDFAPHIYHQGGTYGPGLWNKAYYPHFYRDIWQILRRPEAMNPVVNFDRFEGSSPHNTSSRGNLDELQMAVPPMHGEGDPYKQYRQFIYGILRKPGQENKLQSDIDSNRIPNSFPRAMPALAGNNPISNVAAEKFLRLTDTQLFLLKQWADGKFVNEYLEWGYHEDGAKESSKPPSNGFELDRGVIGHALGGSFCPGGEVSWIMMNPTIYQEPYRLKHSKNYTLGNPSYPYPVTVKEPATKREPPKNPLKDGLEPGDLTKYTGVPWQSDFTYCATQEPIDITYDNWNKLYPDSTGDNILKKAVSHSGDIFWWPAHRPFIVKDEVKGSGFWASGVSELMASDDPEKNSEGCVKMVDMWHELGFIKYLDEEHAPKNSQGSPMPGIYQVEMPKSRQDSWLSSKGMAKKLAEQKTPDPVSHAKIHHDSADDMADSLASQENAPVNHAKIHHEA